MSRYIEAELLIEAMQGRKFANDECMRYDTDSSSKEYYRHLQFEDGIMMDFVREQPTADVKPVVHGKWRAGISPSKTMYVYYCSNCNSYYPLPDGLNFCPNCGADMREVEE